MSRPNEPNGPLACTGLPRRHATPRAGPVGLKHYTYWQWQANRSECTTLSTSPCVYTVLPWVTKSTHLYHYGSTTAFFFGWSKTTQQNLVKSNVAYARRFTGTDIDDIFVDLKFIPCFFFFFPSSFLYLIHEIQYVKSKW